MNEDDKRRIAALELLYKELEERATKAEREHKKLVKRLDAVEETLVFLVKGGDA